MIDDNRPSKRQWWIGLLMTNGTFHVRRYNGPFDFTRSNDYAQYSQSKVVEKIYGPVSIHKRIDHRSILTRKLERDREESRQDRRRRHATMQNL